jgi:peptidoglycan/xylan/chitin deacetylase (PgdA/CDA1 family)
MEKFKEIYYIFLSVCLGFFLILSFGQAVSQKPQTIVNNKVAQPLIQKPLTIINLAKAQAEKINSDFCLAVPVLMYHHIEPRAKAIIEKHSTLSVDSDRFERQLQYLVEQKYQLVKAGDLVNSLRTGQNNPGKTAVITIDDGYLDAYEYVFPLVEKYNLIVNLMVPTGLVGSPGYLTWPQLKEMTASGLVYVYSHTRSHWQLTKADRKKLEQEILGAQADLKDHLGLTENILTYPYGAYNQTVLDFLEEHDYPAAFSTIKGRQSCLANILTLPRLRIGQENLSAYGL